MPNEEGILHSGSSGFRTCTKDVSKYDFSQCMNLPTYLFGDGFAATAIGLRRVS